MNRLETALEFREAMVHAHKADGFIQSDQAEQAMRNVPRHRFRHWLPFKTVHARGAHPLPGASEATTSTIADPAAVAVMLEPLDLQPGQRVLEISVGSGFNAA